MRFLNQWLCFLLFAVVLRGADRTLADAQHAQLLLGPTVWSRVLRIENEARVSAYPRTLHALVFEFGGILWFYTGVNGTQSLSLQRGRLEEEKADLTPLLHDIEPGFRRWRDVATTRPPAIGATGPLWNGCVIESIVALRRRVALGAETSRPALFAYYADSPSGPAGHTVLVFEDGDRAGVIDPARGSEVRWFPAPQLRDPLALARQVGGPRITRAKFFPLEVPADWIQAVAAGDSFERGSLPGRIVTVR